MLIQPTEALLLYLVKAHKDLKLVGVMESAWHSDGDQNKDGGRGGGGMIVAASEARVIRATMADSTTLARTRDM